MPISEVGGPRFSSSGGGQADPALQSALKSLHNSPAWQKLLQLEGKKCTPEQMSKILDHDTVTLLQKALKALLQSTDKTSPLYTQLASYFKQYTDSNGHTLEDALVLTTPTDNSNLSTWFSDMENNIRTSPGLDTFNYFNGAVEAYMG